MRVGGLYVHHYIFETTQAIAIESIRIESKTYVLCIPQLSIFLSMTKNPPANASERIMRNAFPKLKIFHTFTLFLSPCARHFVRYTANPVSRLVGRTFAMIRHPFGAYVIRAQRACKSFERFVCRLVVCVAYLPE